MSVRRDTAGEQWGPVERSILFRATYDLIYLDSVFLEHGGRESSVLEALERLLNAGYAEIGADIDGLQPWNTATEASVATAVAALGRGGSGAAPVPVWLRLTPRGRTAAATRPR
ncbi:hypothetical protein G4H71_11435 [Rhodococcus triatomae]|uniref:Uncharacterized protein n=1 Tax=Rhodococcus triatomae TaxID=300028 RepID=A0A1G8L635_9NOCA|nr:hypothetical protein [Rhodococcus triatomae]QNG20515.1 hypothetical protein G4H72_18945 [Rhodococcus triatomae]QNG23567.1 hypothetical protein G4H71_11435 [Rhodococcus triatomae]SDI51146.1 hypothetical protein SAMN05444695_10876 [Rhodococcus triatomae]